MPLRFRFDVLDRLRESGYTTYRIRKERLLPEGTLQNLRDCKPVSWTTIETICRLLDCQPGDVLEYAPEDQTND